MLNDIIQYCLRHELWSIESTGFLFYKEYINESLSRMADAGGYSIEIPEEELATAVLIDSSPEIVPEWLR